MTLEIPEGWQLVPKEPTLAMCSAYEQAMSEYIRKLPANVRQKRHYAPRGYMVPESVKVKIRWQAMLRAAPLPQSIG